MRREEQEIADLEARIAHGAPPRGSNPLASDALAPPSTVSEAGGPTPQGLPSPGATSATLKRKGQEQGKVQGGEGDDTRTRPYVGTKLFADMPLSEKTQRGLRVRGIPELINPKVGSPKPSVFEGPAWEPGPP